jgi:hypothetical protein
MQLLNFLVEHHLALFISEAEMAAGMNPVRRQREVAPLKSTQSSWHTVIPIYQE